MYNVFICTTETTTWHHKQTLLDKTVKAAVFCILWINLSPDSFIVGNTSPGAQERSTTSLIIRRAEGCAKTCSNHE